VNRCMFGVTAPVGWQLTTSRQPHGERRTVGTPLRSDKLEGTER